MVGLERAGRRAESAIRAHVRLLNAIGLSGEVAGTRKARRELATVAPVVKGSKWDDLYPDASEALD